MSAGLHFATQKQVKTKKMVIKSADIHFSAPTRVKTKKQRSSRPQAVVCIVIFQKFSLKNDMTCFTVYDAEMENIWLFFGVLGGQKFIGKKGGHFLQKEDVWLPYIKGKIKFRTQA